MRITIRKRADRMSKNRRRKQKQPRQTLPGVSNEPTTHRPLPPLEPKADFGKGQVAVTMSRQEYYSGPLPHPDILASYDRLVPGAAERMISLVEKQADHRMDLERTVVRGDNRRADIGLVAGIVATFTAMFLATFLAFFGWTAGAGILVGSGMATMIGSLVSVKRKRNQELDAKKASAKGDGKGKEVATKGKP